MARLSAKAIKNYSNINSFDYANQWDIRSGEPNSLYFQLVNLDKVDYATKMPLRYIPASGSTVSVKFPSIDDDAVITVSATAVSVDDRSLWVADLTALQEPASGNVVISVTEGGVTRSFSVLNMLSVESPGNDGSC